MAEPSGPPPPYPGSDQEKSGYPTQGGYPPQQPGYPPPPGAPGAPAFTQPTYPAQPAYPPAPQAMHPQPGGPPAPGQATTVVITQPTTVLHQRFRESPLQMTCPTCRHNIVTTMDYETGTFAWLLCVIIFLVGCQLGCCLIPFCVDGAKDVVHTCPNCNTMLGRYNRL